MNLPDNVAAPSTEAEITSIAPQGSGPTSAQRWLSFAEFLVGGAIVIGHNVYHVLPNEVYLLVVIGLVSVKLREGSWAAMGLRWPTSWRRTVLFALAGAALRIVLAAVVVDPLTAHFWPPAQAPSGAEQIQGHVLVALRWLLIVWTFAAFGEEISYRGYLITRAADIGGRTKAAYWLAVIAVAVLFGYGHYYKGPAGMVDSGMAGLILGAAYVLSGRNLWICILAHGFIDTFGVIALFLGWQS
jgi:membrane protease YdiL (CAAX protease family)